MISRKRKIEILRTFYNNVAMKDVNSQCPFGKNYGAPMIEPHHKMQCIDLCGTWLELGDVQRGCPCHTLGSDVAMMQVHKILKKEGVI
jgi:hypothetical protein